MVSEGDKYVWISGGFSSYYFSKGCIREVGMIVL